MHPGTSRKNRYPGPRDGRGERRASASAASAGGKAGARTFRSRASGAECSETPPDTHGRELRFVCERARGRVGVQSAPCALSTSSLGPGADEGRELRIISHKTHTISHNLRCKSTRALGSRVVRVVCREAQSIVRLRGATRDSAAPALRVRSPHGGVSRSRRVRAALFARSRRRRRRASPPLPFRAALRRSSRVARVGGRA